MHIGMTQPLRAPNGPEVASLVADAFAKVFDHIDQIDPDQILAGVGGHQGGGVTGFDDHSAG